MKNLFLIAGFLLLFQTGDQHERVLKLDISVSQIEIDDAGNLYVVEDNKVSMYSSDGDLEYAYSNMYTVRIHSIDVSNPQKILVFYKVDQKITLLTQYFRTEQDPFFLKKKGYENITAACLSSDDNVWVFDDENQALIKLTDSGDFITTGDKIPASAGSEVKASFMADYKGRVYISDPTKGILIFNPIGEYIETLPLKGVTHFRMDNGKIFYTLNREAYIYHLETGELQKVKMPVSTYNTATVDLQGNKMMMYVSDKNKLDVIKMSVVEK